MCMQNEGLHLLNIVILKVRKTILVLYVIVFIDDYIATVDMDVVATTLHHDLHPWFKPSMKH